jgi:hypothetical protein
MKCGVAGGFGRRGGMELKAQVLYLGQCLGQCIASEFPEGSGRFAN